MIRELLFLLTISIFTIGCCNEPNALCGDRALTEVKNFLKVGNRDSGTIGAKKAAEHIQNRLKEIGFENAQIDAFSDKSPNGEIEFHNVLAELKGDENRWIVLGSHFDTKAGIPNFQGANDSGSSTGLLLEIARVLKKQKPKQSILFAFFDGEECMKNYSDHDGLHGSKHLAQKLKKEKREIDAVIIIDMIGDKDLQLTIPTNSDLKLRYFLETAAKNANCKTVPVGYVLDDHVPFAEAGFPSIDLIDFFFGSAPYKNDYWHTPEDSIDKLSEKSLETVGSIVLEMVEKIDSDQ